MFDGRSQSFNEWHHSLRIESRSAAKYRLLRKWKWKRLSLWLILSNVYRCTLCKSTQPVPKVFVPSAHVHFTVCMWAGNENGTSILRSFSVCCNVQNKASLISIKRHTIFFYYCGLSVIWPSSHHIYFSSHTYAMHTSYAMRYKRKNRK